MGSMLSGRGGGVRARVGGRGTGAREGGVGGLLSTNLCVCVLGDSGVSPDLLDRISATVEERGTPRVNNTEHFLLGEELQQSVDIYI